MIGSIALTGFIGYILYKFADSPLSPGNIEARKERRKFAEIMDKHERTFGTGVNLIMPPTKHGMEDEHKIGTIYEKEIGKDAKGSNGHNTFGPYADVEENKEIDYTNEEVIDEEEKEEHSLW